jgi:hypothetical protein
MSKSIPKTGMLVNSHVTVCDTHHHIPSRVHPPTLGTSQLKMQGKGRDGLRMGAGREEETGKNTGGRGLTALTREIIMNL